ncbi:uncharacterized protein LOC132708684 [Cylas formicarius]|uniref:uncharacterized protein LOC132708684 n=1 Tax=Cylas formicarius TaxID=197179 RepID=UPI0029584C7B|nr:uncharacterized protein LOC132708684 [Cylas formicarius]
MTMKPASVFQIIFYTSTICMQSGNGIRGSGKLDLAALKQETPLSKNIEIPIHQVTCTSGNCNATHSQNNSVQTEVLVHVRVETNLDQNKNNNNIPDVPVVIGLQAAELDTTIDEDQYKKYNLPREEYVPFKPSHVAPTRYDSPITKDYHDYDSVVNRMRETNNEVIIPQVNTYHFTDKSGTRNRFGENGVELSIPHFEPLYNHHYFGEDGPPHSLWYPRNSNGYNPVAFRNVLGMNNWRPLGSTGNRFATATNNNQYGRKHFLDTIYRRPSIGCWCGDHHSSIPNRKSGPNDRSNANGSIDDKLAPLN